MEKHRYLIDINPNKLQKEYHDVIIIGSGIAGIYAAIKIPKEYDIVILTKKTLDVSNSALAQGGIAVSLNKDDSPNFHLRDTLYAGAGLCNERTVKVLVNEASENITSLCKLGVEFDRSQNGGLSLTREGAHSKNRIIHAGDITGKVVCDKLNSIVKTYHNIKIKETTFVLDILTENNICKGVIAYDENNSTFKLYLANVVVCATGGYGQLYAATTNPEVSTGDGVCFAYRAGAELMNLELVQFHPTAFYHPENKNFLISEAVRGEGALLKNIKGIRFMPEYHEFNELAPRDVVSRAIFEEMRKTDVEYVYLDITFKSKEYLERRFPNIYKTCLGYGVDMAKDYIPVAPVQHYCMGGIKTDEYGRTNITGFYSCGEAACNGIHGANRLASNSLLEGLVFGSRIGKEIPNILNNSLKKKDFTFRYETSRAPLNIDKQAIKKEIQEIMTKNAGIVRDRDGLLFAKKKVDVYSNLVEQMTNQCIDDFELQNYVLLSKLVLESALEREESRGAHFRSDFRETDDKKWRKNIIKKWG
ncbi:L-aspartate oxidase|uniref:L-aspartate oxidase n=1 Tax=Dendrosporobacter quercicolus TaxID=146817 RepID=A0A1G9VXH6_9FIRM|nr:L-aspartate oxidase [Dendrosporobacter quercicolus]NSL47773.1 L-aspartate oxidase [Dendrosporobacter quercicolus DSM 1736]SDM76959.1 L-aspartate oxidase [Dendrosporobacter quercicolus]